MNKKDLDEAMTVTNTVLDALLLVLQGKSGMQGAKLRFACGYIQANGATMLDGGGLLFWQWLIGAFEAAPGAGATFDAVDAVRATAEALAPIGAPAIAVRNFVVRMALAEQARILAVTTFKSRQEIDRYFDRINASFDAAEQIAADNLDNVAYRALITIHAAVSNDLANRARPLPRMVTYNFPKRMPSLTLAQRLYADGARSGELIDENSPIHPLFMPQKIAALSA